MDSFKSAGPTSADSTALWLLTRVLANLIGDPEKRCFIGDSILFTAFMEKEFGKHPIKMKREDVWHEMISRMGKDSFTGYELGVAWGYTTNFWLSRCPGIQEWHGFDLFTGLPDHWRGFQAGEFSAAGQTPPIQDPRVKWHIGLVQETLPMVIPTTGKKVIIFDLDLYDPTLFSWQRLKDSLHCGDLLYFDEPYDRGEREILEGHVLNEFEVNLVGYSPLCCALEVVGRKQPATDYSKPVETYDKPTAA